MNYAIHVLLADENTVVITLDDLGKVDQAVAILGEKFSEPRGITVMTQDQFGHDLHVLHKQTFTLGE